MSNVDSNTKLNMARPQDQRGVIVAYVLVFGAIALTLLGGLLGFVITQLKMTEQKTSWNEALNIAEAGIDYYRWCLNNGIESNCTGEKDYTDSGGNVRGKFSLAIDATTICGQMIKRTITSSGWTNEFPATRRSVRVLYARASAAAYSGVINDGVWFGNDEALSGPFMANGGVRMDGPNQSLVSSAALLSLNGTTTGEWVCDSSYGCSPCPTGAGKCRIASAKCVCPGVFTTTANANASLFQYPVPPFDFNAITIDLAAIKDKAQHGGGIYLPKSNTVNANGKGYHLKFQNDGTVKVYIVTSTTRTYSYNTGEWDYFTIANNGETPYSTPIYTIPAACSAIYAEDNVWPEGTIKGKVTLASANLIATDNIDTNIILGNNITYATSSGNGLVAIAEGSAFIGPQSPDNLELHGIYVAQKGAFYRNDYSGNIKTNFVLYGSYISKGRPNETWVYSDGSVESRWKLASES